MKLRQLFGRRKEDSELLHELDSHLQHEIDDNIAQGMSAKRPAARRM